MARELLWDEINVSIKCAKRRNIKTSLSLSDHNGLTLYKLAVESFGFFV